MKGVLKYDSLQKVMILRHFDQPFCFLPILIVLRCPAVCQEKSAKIRINFVGSEVKNGDLGGCAGGVGICVAIYAVAAVEVGVDTDVRADACAKAFGG